MFWFVVISLCIFISMINIQAEAREFETYDKFQQAVNSLEEAEKYEEALELSKTVWEKFPENQFDLTKEFIYLYEKLKKYERSFEIWQYGHEKGYFYLIHPGLPNFAPYKEFDQFNQFVEKDAQLREAALEKSKTIYDVVLPTDYDESRQYPLFFVLHGGGSSMKLAKKRWQPTDKIQQNFIISYIQSYLHYDFNTYGWRAFDERTREELTQNYNEIIDKYSVDTTAVFISGMSAGGTAAMDVAINQIFPIKGVLGICPGKPQKFDEEAVKNCNNLGMKIVMISGEKDHYLEKQRTMEEIFAQVQIPYQFEIIPEMGHGIPEDLPERWEKAIEFLR